MAEEFAGCPSCAYVRKEKTGFYCVFHDEYVSSTTVCSAHEDALSTPIFQEAMGEDRHVPRFLVSDYAAFIMSGLIVSIAVFLGIMVNF